MGGGYKQHVTKLNNTSAVLVVSAIYLVLLRPDECVLVRRKKFAAQNSCLRDKVFRLHFKARKRGVVDVEKVAHRTVNVLGGLHQPGPNGVEITPQIFAQLLQGCFSAVPDDEQQDCLAPSRGRLE